LHTPRVEVDTTRSTAHRLAFGMFWMIIPHVAVVSSVLLAGNNPSSWAGVASHLSRTDVEKVSTISSSRTSPGSSTSQSPPAENGRSKFSVWRFRSFHFSIFHPSYPGQYYPAWLWNRGTNKAMWLSKLVKEHPHLSSVQTEVLHLGPKKWLLYCILPTNTLLIIPSLLGLIIR
jgi:hypothetical protein